MAMLGGAEQSGATGIAVEARQAEPVDQTVAPDQRRAAAVADQRVILDTAGHDSRSKRDT
jgi:hypothetical protein